MGLVADFPYNLVLHANATLLVCRPIQYPAKQREWIHNYCDGLVKKGVIRKCSGEIGVFLHKVVLVARPGD